MKLLTRQSFRRTSKSSRSYRSRFSSVRVVFALLMLTTLGLTAHAAEPKAIAGTNKVDLSWDPVTGAAFYRVSYKDDSKGPLDKYTHKYPYSANTTIFGLTNGVRYEFQIKPLNEYKGPLRGSRASKFFYSTPIGVPSSLRATIGAKKVTLTWQPVAGATTYKIQGRISKFTILEKSVPAPNDPLLDVSTFFDNLHNGTPYNFVVRALKPSGKGDYSPATSATPIAVPTGLQATAGTKKVVLSWDAITGATSYNLMQVSPGNPTVSYSIAGVSTVVRSLTNGKTYRFRVRATNPTGSGDFSTAISATPIAVPSNLRATIGEKKVTLTWQPVAKATTYTLERVDPDPMEFLVPAPQSLADVSIHVNRSTNAKTCRFRVRATNLTGKGDFSPTISVTPLAVPTGLKASAGVHHVTLTWDATSGATSYVIAQDDTLFYEVTAGTRKEIIGLKNVTTYQFKVKAKNAKGSGNFSSPVRIATAKSALPTPKNLSTTAADQQISLWWDRVSDVDGYRIEYGADGTTKTVTYSMNYHVVTGLTNDVLYNLRVQTIKGNLRGLFSHTIQSLPQPSVSYGGWVGTTSTIVVFPSSLNLSYEFYRTRDENCDLGDYTQCAQGQKDTLGGSRYSFTDSALSLNNRAYYTLERLVQLKNRAGGQHLTRITHAITTTVLRFSVSARRKHQMVAFKNKLYLIGGSDDGGYKNDVWSSANGRTWVEVTANAAFSGRSGHQVVAFKDKMYLIGGGDGYLKNDVWSSTNGRTWAIETRHAAFSARLEHQVVVFKDKMYLIGGYAGYTSGRYKNDVWSSTNGRTWIQETAGARFSARSDHQVVAFKDKIYLIGGYAAGGYQNDVWSSTNSRTWIEETRHAAFSARSNHQVVTFKDKMYLIGGSGGGYRNDVWSSIDGKTWIQVTAHAEFFARDDHQVVAFKDKMYLIGGEVGHRQYKNDVWSSINGRTWVEVGAGFSARYVHQAVAFKDKMYLIGGADGKYRNDVWSFTNGRGWIQETANAEFSARRYHQVVVFKDKMYLIGGSAENRRLKNDVWSSANGRTWIQETANAQFSARDGHDVVAFKDKLYLIGGHDGSNYRNDVWSSTNGRTWVEVTDRAGFSARSRLQTVAFKDKLYLNGGYNGHHSEQYKNDVWSSTNGRTWIQETANAQFSARDGHEVVAFKDKLYLIAGHDASNYRNDVWSSTNGRTWVEVTASAGFSVRYLHQVVAFKDKMYLIGGSDGSRKNDVWRSADGKTWRSYTAGEFFFP